MLNLVRIENFRCLKSVKVPLRPLTVLIGPNDSGKSAFLAALYKSANNLSFPITDHWRAEAAQVPTIRADSTGGPVRPAELYQLPSRGVSMESSGHSDESGLPPIDAEGTGVPGLLDYLLRRDRKRFFDFVTAVRALVPGLEEVEIATPKPDRRRLDLVIENGFRIPADQASAGVRLLLFFVALAYHPSPPRLILLEEPENGLHPKRLADVVKLLRDIAMGQHAGHAAQVVLTTHSPYLLDHVDLATDQILIFRRNDDGSRSAEPADAGRLKTFLDEFMLGEVWFNQGEEGLLAVPVK